MQATAAGKPKLPPLQLLVSGLIAFAASVGPLAAAASTTGARLAGIGVPFIANQGQIDSRVSFYARTFAGTVFVTSDGRLVYSLASNRQQPRATPAAGNAAVTGWTLSESFAPASTAPVGLRPAAARVSSFVGPAAATRPDLPTFESVGLGEIAPGISLEVRTTGNNIEKLFQVAPGADVRGIHARIDGAEGLSLAADGGLIIATGLGAVQFTAPVAYQERAGSRTPVPVRYELAGGTGYGFATGDYDRSLPLIIDPLIRSTFSGGNGEDAIRAMLVHPGSGDVYVAGSTTSTNFPGTGTGAQTANPSGTDAFVARYNAGLTNLVRASYYGAANTTIANAIAILPSSGDIYIAGTTSSASGLLNMTGTLSGTFDAFIARFDGALSNVLGARYYGGSGDEEASGLAIDNLAGDVIVAGATTSSDLTLGSGTTSTGGGQDAFVAKFSANLAALTTAAYFGGGGTDRALAVARDPLTGDIVLAGVTDSTNLTGTANGALPTYGGGTSDGFAARFNATLTTLLQSTYFGGSGTDQINAVAIHPLNGQVYVAGDTESIDLRGKPVGQLNTGGGKDAFIARLHKDLSGLQAVTYYGGGGDDVANALAISRYSGEVYVAGYSTSSNLPGTASGIQAVKAAGNDAYVARFDAGLSGVKQSTFLGGSGSDIAQAVALTDSAVYVAGATASTTLAGAAPTGTQALSGGGGSDGFISALGTDLREGNSNPAPFAFAAIVGALPSSVQTSAPAKVTPTGDATGYVDGQPGSTWCASSLANCSSCDRTGGFIGGSATLLGPNPYYVCVRHTASAAPDVITESTLHIGAVAATFRVGTGAIPGFGCTLDIDLNGAQDALTDGLLVIRALFGLTGTAVTNGAIGTNALRTGWSDISAYLNTNCGANVAP